MANKAQKVARALAEAQATQSYHANSAAIGLLHDRALHKDSLQGKAHLSAAFELVVVHGATIKEAARATGTSFNTLANYSRRHGWVRLRSRYEQAARSADQEYELTMAAKRQAEDLLDFTDRCEKRLRMLETMLSNVLTHAYLTSTVETVTLPDGSTRQVSVPGISVAKMHEVLALNAEVAKQIAELAKLNKTEVQHRISRCSRYLQQLEPRLRRDAAALLNVALPGTVIDGETTSKPPAPSSAPPKPRPLRATP